MSRAVPTVVAAGLQPSGATDHQRGAASGASGKTGGRTQGCSTTPYGDFDAVARACAAWKGVDDAVLVQEFSGNLEKDQRKISAKHALVPSARFQGALDEHGPHGAILCDSLW